MAQDSKIEFRWWLCRNAEQFLAELTERGYSDSHIRRNGIFGQEAAGVIKGIRKRGQAFLDELTDFKDSQVKSFFWYCATETLREFDLNLYTPKRPKSK